jgi:hypothetical protein
MAQPPNLIWDPATGDYKNNPAFYALTIPQRDYILGSGPAVPLPTGWGAYDYGATTGSQSTTLKPAMPTVGTTNPITTNMPTTTLGSVTTPSATYPTGNLEPGMTGAEVKKLQDYLVSGGYMTQAQVNTGYGTYGPQTTAAVSALQKALGVDTAGYSGYWGPKTLAALSKTTGGTTTGTPSGGTPTGGITPTGGTPTGGATPVGGTTSTGGTPITLDDILAKLGGAIGGTDPLAEVKAMMAKMQTQQDEYINFLKSQPTAQQIYTQEREKLGIPAREAVLGGINAQITTTQGLLDKLESDIQSRIGGMTGVQLTESQRARELAVEQKPLAKQIGQLGTAASAEQAQLTPLQNQLSALMGFQSAEQEKQAAIAKAPLEATQALLPTALSMAQYQSPQQQAALSIAQEELLRSLGLGSYYQDTSKAAEVIGTAETGVFQWNPTTKKYDIQVMAPQTENWSSPYTLNTGDVAQKNSRTGEIKVISQYNAPSAGGPGTISGMDKRVQDIVAMYPVNGVVGGRSNIPNGKQWDAAADKIDAEFGAGTATKYGSYLESVYAGGGAAPMSDLSAGTLSTVNDLLNTSDLSWITSLPIDLLSGNKKVLKSKLNQLTQQLSLNARSLIKGQGAISDKETAMLQEAQSIISTPRLGQEELRTELRRIKGVLLANSGATVNVRIIQNGKVVDEGALNRDQIYSALQQGLQVIYL